MIVNFYSILYLANGCGFAWYSLVSIFSSLNFTGLMRIMNAEGGGDHPSEDLHRTSGMDDGGGLH